MCEGQKICFEGFEKLITVSYDNSLNDDGDENHQDPPPPPRQSGQCPLNNQDISCISNLFGTAGCQLVVAQPRALTLSLETVHHLQGFLSS